MDVLSTALTLMLVMDPLGNIPAFMAALGAWVVSSLVLLRAPFFAGELRRRGLMAVERLMGLLLVVVAVQMFLEGLYLP
ncbi:MAG: MarC family protein [Verrucomicrobiota bacterium]